MESPVISTATTPAGYGHACGACVRAKCKCIIRPGGICERCNRLGKECTPATFVRKRGAKRTNTSTKRSQLEDKLEDLVTLLQAQHSASQPNTTATPAQITPRGVPEQSNNRTPTPTTTLTSSASNASPPLIAFRGNGTLANEAFSINPESVLDTFRTHHLPFFPFIYLPTTITAEQLQREKPCLWLNIVAICTKEPDKQGEMGLRIREYIATRVLLRGERDIDLLQGTIAGLAWCYKVLISAPGKPFVGVFANLARSLLVDLRLDRLSGDNTVGPLYCTKPWSFHQQPQGINFRTNEERRILLACLIATSLACTMGKCDPIRWSPQVEESVSRLSQDQESPEDATLVAMARLSHVADDAVKAIRSSGDSREHVAPPMLHVRPLHAALDEAKKKIPTHLRDNKIILSYTYNTEVRIYELALIHDRSSPSDQTFGFRRFEYLHACLQSSKACMENHLSFDFIACKGISFPLMVHCSQSMQILFKLLLLDDPGWDRAAVRATVDVLSYLEQCAAQLERVDEGLDLEPGRTEGSIFQRAAEAVRGAIPVWRADLEKVGLEPSQTIGQQRVEDLMDPAMMGFSDDGWFNGLFAESGWRA